MPFPALMLPILAALAQTAQPPAVSSRKDIIVTGRGGVPFISPMGEPIRARRPNEDTLARWFSQVDRNHDGFITPDELEADAVRYFTEVLDTNHDGQIDPDELVHYEWTVAPEIQVNSRLRRARAPGEKPAKAESDRDSDDSWPSDDGEMRRERHGGDEGEMRRGKHGRSDDPMDHGPQGAARYALLNIPEPVAAADADFNRAITLAEFKDAALERFQLLDRNHQGKVTLAELEAMLPKLPPPGTKIKHKPDEPDTRVGEPLPPGN
jgi:Ca2+-binding EF-hand superfamily protein